MKLSRRPVIAVVLATALAGLGALPGASAAPPCDLVKDPMGDSAVLTDQPGMDIVSADMATTAKAVTMVIRLAAAPNTLNPEAVGGTRYYFEFVAPGSANPQFLRANIDFGTGALTVTSGEKTPSATGSSYSNDPANPDITAKIEGKVLTMSAPLSAFTRVTPAVGKKLRTITVSSFARAGTFILLADEAVTTKTYVAGSKNCVKVA